MGKHLWFTVKGGHFALNAELRERLTPVLRPRVYRAALAVQAGIQKSSPVKTGNLRRSWTTAEPAWQEQKLISKVGTATVYAQYQNEKTVNKGYVGRGIAAGKTAAVAELKAGLREAAKAVWVKG